MVCGRKNKPVHIEKSQDTKVDVFLTYPFWKLAFRRFLFGYAGKLKFWNCADRQDVYAALMSTSVIVNLIKRK